MVGPSFFTVRQTVASVRAPQDITDPPPYNNLSISTVTLTDVKDSPVGVNVGRRRHLLDTHDTRLGQASA